MYSHTSSSRIYRATRHLVTRFLFVYRYNACLLLVRSKNKQYATYTILKLSNSPCSIMIQDAPTSLVVSHCSSYPEMLLDPFDVITDVIPSTPLSTVRVTLNGLAPTWAGGAFNGNSLETSVSLPNSVALLSRTVQTITLLLTVQVYCTGADGQTMGQGRSAVYVASCPRIVTAWRRWVYQQFMPKKSAIVRYLNGKVQECF